MPRSADSGQPPRRAVKRAVPKAKPAKAAAKPTPADPTELVIITGMSGSGKLSALKAFEDLGYYSVDNLPLELIQPFAELVRTSREITRAALVVDVREGSNLRRLPAFLRGIRKALPTRVLFLEAADEALVRRFSETRRPHPLKRAQSVLQAIRTERKLLDPIRNVADLTIDTTRFNVHELRAHINTQFQHEGGGKNLQISTVSFGFKNGVPNDADLVFDVRFLPNPHFIPEFRKLTGRHPRVAHYIRQFPQTKEFIDKTVDMLLFLLPHYITEGKSYLTIAFGCTGGQHRSVMIAEEIRKLLTRQGYRTKTTHRDMPR